MPQSGGWLNSVKVVMGFLELAAAFKFLSNMDLVWGWGFFTYNMVLITWTILSLLTGIYLLGKIKLPHDNKLEFISVPRLLISMLFLIMGLYLGTGCFGQPIHGLIISYLPPKENSSITNNSKTRSSHESQWLYSLDEAFLKAKSEQKPIFIDFTGYTCTNCRWMESNMFTKPEIVNRFDKFILVQLYTDGGENHRKNQQYEIDRFGTSALPYYVLLTPDDEVIDEFPGMTRDVNEFIDFLDSAL